MAKRVYYKVTSQDLQSVCRNWAFPDDYRVKYQLQEFVEPTQKETRLFVFGSVESARNFCYNEMNGCGVRLFECEVKNPHPVKYIASPAKVEEFWKILNKARSLRKNFEKLFLDAVGKWGLRDDVPSSSYAVTHVKLTKELSL